MPHYYSTRLQFLQFVFI